MQLPVLRFPLLRTASYEVFRRLSIPNDLAMLSSARMVGAVETEDSKRLDEPKIKQITGGDTITARFLHKEFFEFKPQFKIWLATNALPVVRTAAAKRCLDNP